MLLGEGPPPAERILVIKLGALGDFVQAMGPFKAIRAAYPDADITLLTTKIYEDLAERSGLFDDVWLDQRPRGPLGYWTLRRRLLAAEFDMVYDLQTSDRSSLYWRMMWPLQPLLSGIASGASHPHANPDRDNMHTIDRQREQLNMAGIKEVPPPDLAWVQGGIADFGLTSPFALLVPGGAAHRPEKRWAVEHYAELAVWLRDQGITPALIGTPNEADLMAAIVVDCPEAVDLTGRTQLTDLAVLARDAILAIGNDTGPMHVFAAAGCASVVLFGSASDPALCAPRGRAVKVIQVPDLDTLPVYQVAETLSGFALASDPASA